jgi:hypothetical protein
MILSHEFNFLPTSMALERYSFSKGPCDGSTIFLNPRLYSATSHAILGFDGALESAQKH